MPQRQPIRSARGGHHEHAGLEALALPDIAPMLFGRTPNRNLDHRDNWPIFETAAALRAPLYIHPQSPVPAVRDALYGGFGDDVDAAFATFGLGWHCETGVQILRMILARTASNSIRPCFNIVPLSATPHASSAQLSGMMSIAKLSLSRQGAERCRSNYPSP
ncbi:hypothetical protein [Mesorhizobium sanjuanii]|uniref:hypothetical protein n=1 Tax=Mesorhizobium sanjuanii TaxID=2037900 RepID=UPI001AD7E956|nr:hypothetical protein [Mesorhizobium sanjuanii]